MASQYYFQRVNNSQGNQNMADVIEKIDGGENINNGGMVIYRGSKTMFTIVEDTSDAPDVSGVEAKFTDRFDDPDYYTA